jgi:endonuclease/exonuclease/phosphatase family metal-dependent hydrolase
MRPVSVRSPLLTPALAKTLSLIAAVALAGCDGASVPTALQPPSAATSGSASIGGSDRDRRGGHHDEITVMTYNIYQGTELENTIKATDNLSFVLGAAQDFDMMRQTNFAERARAIVAEIDASVPDLVGMQEVARWQASPPAPGAPQLREGQDFLQLLLDALSARDLRYVVVANVNNFDVNGLGLFSGGFMNLRLTDRNVILARVDERGDGPVLSNPKSGNFKTNLVITVVGNPVTVLEGWASIDVRVHGQTIRFITTHLDAFAPPIRLAQATELLRGPANTTLPVILAGDMNTTSTTDTYAALTIAGFVDLWPQLHPGVAGLTCCQTLPAIDNPSPALYERVDLLLLRGGLDGESIRLVGANVADRTASGLWPSDHAGLVARISVDGQH